MPPTKTALVCKICGADRSRSGRSFDERSLAKHMAMFHREEDAPADAPLACDICGATASGRGKKFLTMASVHQHKKKSHPESAGQPPAPTVDAASKPAPPSRNGHKRPQSASPAQLSARAGSHVKFCPCCGFNLTVVNAAMQFVNGDS